MSAMIKAITKQFDANFPFSRTTLLIVAVWAAVFITFTVLGLQR
jgi:hypothetical protein